MKAVEENDKLVETILGKESPAEVKIRAEIEKLTRKLQQLDCELWKVKKNRIRFVKTDLHLNFNSN